MPKKIGPERAHFGGELGLITETRENGRPRYYWRCVHCNYHLGGKVFPNVRARIHLSGDTSLRSGVIAQVCTRAPEEVQKAFREIIATKKAEKAEKVARYKRVRELVNTNLAASPAKQNRIYVHPPIEYLDDDEVDQAWGRAFFTLDIAQNKVEQDFFREAIAATKSSKPK